MNFLNKEYKLMRDSYLLTLLFAISVIGVLLCTNILFYYIFHILDLLFNTKELGNYHRTWTIYTRGHIYLTAFMFTIMIGTFLVRMSILTPGGAYIARYCGAKELPDNKNDYYSRRYRHVAEEIAVATGVPVPRLFVLEGDESINAFAAGYTQNDAVITVTKGALEKLNRDELQGVIAHEFSHILHTDIRLNILLIAFSSSINPLANFGQIFDTGNADPVNQFITIFLLPIRLILVPVGCIGQLFASLLMFGVNRKREYLADASAVRYTRLSSGIVGALKKISGIADLDGAKKPEITMVSHMMFDRSILLLNILATHPPIFERIKALDVNFSETDLKKMREQFKLSPPNGIQEDLMLGFCHENDINLVTTGDSEIDATYEITNLNYLSVTSDIPPSMLQAGRNYYGAVPLVLALLYSTVPNIQAKQMKVIEANYNEITVININAFSTEVRKMDQSIRLHLSAICFPSLAKHPRDELSKLVDIIFELIHADDAVSVYKYCLGTMIIKQIKDTINPGRAGIPGSVKLTNAIQEVSCLLAILSQAGAENESDGLKSFQAGMSQLFPGIAIDYQHYTSFAKVLDPVWQTLDNLAPPGKDALIKAMMAVIRYDEKITKGEAELMRTMTSIIHRPLPPDFLGVDINQ